MDGLTCTNQSMKKILFISYDGMTDPLGQSQVIPYLAGLTKFGYQFTILSCDKPDKYAIHKTYVDGLINGLPITWVSIPYHKNPPVLSSLYDFIKLKQIAGQLHQKEHFDMVHTRPGLPALVGLWMKKKFGTSFLNDIRGFWADERVDGGMWNLKNPVFNIIYRYFKKKEDDCIRFADANTCLTEKAFKEIRSWKRVPQPVSLTVIPCSVDMNLFDPENIDLELKESFRKKLAIGPDDLIISYLGSIGGWYMTKEMLQCCQSILDANPTARFLFISNNRHEDIRAAANVYGIPSDKIIIQNGKHHEVPVLLSFSQYSIFFIKPCYSKMSSAPTKHAEIMALGIPVITNSGVGDVKEIVEKYRAGYVLDDFSKQTFEKLAGQLASHSGQASHHAIRRGAMETFSLDAAVQAYRKVYEQILNG